MCICIECTLTCYSHSLLNKVHEQFSLTSTSKLIPTAIVQKSWEPGAGTEMKGREKGEKRNKGQRMGARRRQRGRNKGCHCIPKLHIPNHIWLQYRHFCSPSLPKAFPSNTITWTHTLLEKNYLAQTSSIINAKCCAFLCGCVCVSLHKTPW